MSVSDYTSPQWHAYVIYEYDDDSQQPEPVDVMAESVNSYLSDEFRQQFADVDVQKYQKYTAITTTQTCLIAAYSTLFIIGLGGNFWVACIHGAVWRHTRAGPNSEAPRAVQIYILALCFCDLVVLGFLSALISDLIYGQWVVPSIFLCRLYLSSESVNKFCSPFLLVAMSAYCYFSISKPSALSAGVRPSEQSLYRYVYYLDVRRWTETKVALLIVSASIALVLILVSPVYIFGDLHYVVFQNGTEITEIVQKCAFEPPPALLSAFTIYSFIGGYLVPAASFTLFYTALLYRVRLQAATMRRRPSSEYFGRVAKTTTGLILFYLFCWSPYWIYMLRLNFGSDDEEDSGPPPVASVVFGYIIHTLPYINCTGYPILYTLMNRNIKEAYKKVTTGRRRGTDVSGSTRL